MSITPVPISIRLVLTPMAARSGGSDGQLDGLVERLAAGVGQPAAWMPGAEREEAESLGMRRLLQER
jgi:hypothetical protein